MKRRIRILLFVIVIFTCLVLFLNLNVTTRQGINYQWHTIEVPLYLKVLDFFDRHYNYQWLVRRIIGNSKTDEEKVLRVFKWTYENIKKAPEGYPIIDDHVWHIIVRGYGVDDQSSDVFTTLCNYTGIEAFYNLVFTKDRSSRIYLSFTKVDRGWVIFDPYRGIYFKNRQGDLADIEEIIKGDWVENNIDTVAQEPTLLFKKSDFDYSVYLGNLTFIAGMGLKRGNIQSPIKRLKYEINKWLR